MRLAALASAAVLALAPCAPSRAQTWPDKPVRLVVSFAPGGVHDTLARVLQPRLTDALGQPIVIENRPGAGGNIAALTVAKSAPDGYTFLVASEAIATNKFLYHAMAYDPYKDLEPVAKLADYPMALIANPSVSASNVKELVALAKAKPGSLSYGSAGIGASGHLAGELFKSVAGVEMVHVPYKGGAPALADLIAGRIQVMFLSVSLSAPQLKQGKIKVLAVTGDKRSGKLPEVPTAAEQGFPEVQALLFSSLLAPAGTPESIVTRMNAEVVKALRTPEVVKRITELGAVPAPSSPAQFAGILKGDGERWGALIREKHPRRLKGDPVSGGAFPESPLEFGVFDWIEWSDRPAGEIFEHKLAIAEAADRAGFYAWQIAEHQGTPLSIDGSPSLMLAAAAQRTKKLRLGALTFCLPWYNPFRFYNEICMLDQMSGGRIELGVGRGVSPIESSYFGMKSIDESRERYRETLDIFFAACGTRVLNHEGKYYAYRDLELYVQPHQRPYPPLWFPSSDANSIEFTARHGYHTVLNTSAAEAGKLYAQYRETWTRHRNDPGRHNAHVDAPKLGKSQHVYVADSDARALSEGGAAYQVWSEHLTHLTRKHGKPDLLNVSPGSPAAVTRLVAGSPATVARQLGEIVREARINYLLLVFSFGDLRPEQALRSMDLFVREVMPALRSGAG